MSRPAHIAALDAALDEQLRLFEQGNQDFAAALDEHIVELDRRKAEYEALRSQVEAASNVRVEAYHGAKHCEESIKKLGYVVLGRTADGRAVGGNVSRLDGLTYSLQDDYKRARIRAGLIRPEDDSW